MYQRVRDAKYRIEIVTFVWDFRDHINPGDSIISVVSGVLVSSGNDSNPTDLLLHDPIISDGTIISQRIRRGIPGTIYTVTIEVTTAQGDVFEDLAYLAILPLPTFFFNYFLVTQLYPIEMYYESITAEISLQGGKLFEGYVMPPEGIEASITLEEGTLAGNNVTYSMSVLDGGGVNGNEGLLSFITLDNGILFGQSVSYDMPVGEGIQAVINLVEGTLYGRPLTYGMTTEGIFSIITLDSGTLTP